MQVFSTPYHIRTCLVPGSASYASLQCLVLMRGRIGRTGTAGVPINIRDQAHIYHSYRSTSVSLSRMYYPCLEGFPIRMAQIQRVIHLVKFLHCTIVFCRTQTKAISFEIFFAHLTRRLCVWSGFVTRASQDTCWPRLKDKRG